MVEAENGQATARLFPFMQRAQAFMDTPDEDKTEALCLEAVRLDGRLFRHVPEALKTPAVCLEAVRSWGGVLRDVPPAMATQEMYLEAVKGSGYALSDVPPAERTPELCMAAVKAGSWAFPYVPEERKTDELCMEAFLGGVGIGEMPERLQTPEFCLEAFRRDAGAPEGAPLEADFVLDAIKRKPRRLGFLPKEMRTPEFCRAAVQNWGGTLQWVPDTMKTPELCAEAVHIWGGSLQFVPESMKTRPICLEAVRRCGTALKDVPDRLKTEEICLAAVKSDGWALRYVPERLCTEDLCLDAIWQNSSVLDSVPEALKTEKICGVAASRRTTEEAPADFRMPFAVAVSRKDLEASVRKALPDFPKGSKTLVRLILEDGSAVPLPDEGPVLVRRPFVPLLAEGRGTEIVLHAVLTGETEGHAPVMYPKLNSLASRLLRKGGVVSADRQEEPDPEGCSAVPAMERKEACAAFAAKLRADMPGLDCLVRRVNALLGGRVLSGPADLRALVPEKPRTIGCVFAHASATVKARAAGLSERTDPVFLDSTWHARNPWKLLDTYLHETVHLLGRNGHGRNFWIMLAALGREAGRSGLFSRRMGGARWGDPRFTVSRALSFAGKDGKETMEQVLAEYRRMPRDPIRDLAVRRLAGRRERIAASRRRAAAAAAWRLIR